MAGVLEEIPNTPPDGQVGVIPGTLGVAGVAVAQLLGRDAVVMRFPLDSSWSVQALIDRRASLDTSALVRGKITVGVRSLPERQLQLDCACFALWGPCSPASVSMTQVHQGTMSQAPLSAPARGGHYASGRQTIRRLCHCKVFR